MLLKFFLHSGRQRYRNNRNSDECVPQYWMLYIDTICARPDRPQQDVAIMENNHVPDKRIFSHENNVLEYSTRIIIRTTRLEKTHLMRSSLSEAVKTE